MAKTFNRVPVQVPYPTAKEQKSYYFNHYTWKGINDDKNFLEVDQEAFQEAENVYVDSEGLLRSRPALKQKEAKSGTTVLDNVSDFWIFGDVIVYRNECPSKSTLYFVNKNTSAQLAYTDYSYSNSKPVPLKLILVKRRIFVFSETSLKMFDMDNGTLSSADDFIYVPVTKTITTDTTTETESPNILTNKEIYTYIYDNTVGISSDIYGKSVTFTIDGVTYGPIVFTEQTIEVISQQYCVASSAYNLNANSLNIAVSKDDVVALFSNTTKNLALTYNGKVFNNYTLSSNAGTVLLPVQFSQDGSLVYLVTTTGIWWTSVYADNATGVFTYPDLINVNTIYPNIDVIAPGISNPFFSNETIWGVTIQEDCKIITFAYDNSNVYCDVFNGSGHTLLQTSKTNFSNTAGLPASAGADMTYSGWSYNIVDTYDSSTHTFTYAISISYDHSIVIWGYDADNFASYIIYRKNPLMNGVALKPTADSVLVYFTTLSPYLYKNKYDFSSGQGLDVTEDLSTYGDTSLYYTATMTQVSKIVIPSEAVGDKLFLLTENRVALDHGVANFSSQTIVKWIFGYPVKVWGVGNYVYYSVSIGDTETVVYTTNVSDKLYFNYETVTKYDENNQPVYYNYFVPSNYTELHNYYLAIDSIVRISQDRKNDDGDWLWYLPKNQSQQFNYEITGLHPISDTVVAVFMENEVDYITYDSEKGAYLYQKSKLQLGLPKGNNVISSLDGTTSLFVTKRGLVAMGYQDFIASTEQALSYLSDSIFQLFNDWNNAAIRLHLHGFWLICYKQSTDDCYVYDIRTKSWWHCNYVNHTSNKFVTDGTELIYLVNQGKLFDLYRGDDNYFDDDNPGYDDDGLAYKNIDWKFSSQKLYLDATNYYKHIENMTFNAALDSLRPTEQGEIPNVKNVYRNLQICNYRQVREVTGVENITYKVDLIRTFVLRLNFSKVCEFQYRLSADRTQYPQYPLSLADITIKYKIAGQVR